MQVRGKKLKRVTVLGILCNDSKKDVSTDFDWLEKLMLYDCIERRVQVDLLTGEQLLRCISTKMAIRTLARTYCRLEN